MAASRPKESVCMNQVPAGSASLLTKPRSNVRSVPQPASSRKASAGLLRDATPSVRAKSLPEPRGRTPRRGRADSSSRMSPLTASWITPSPPSTSTVSYSLACAAISVASPRRVVRRISQLTTGASPVFRARSTSMAPSRPRPLCAAGFAMTSVLPQVGSMPAVPIFQKSHTARATIPLQRGRLHSVLPGFGDGHALDRPKAILIHERLSV